MGEVGVSPGGADTVLEERDEELGALGRVLDQAAAARGNIALVEGPGGIGKTSLLHAARGNAEAQGFEVLLARGAEQESPLGFGVVRQLFEPLLGRATSEERSELFAGAAALSRSLVDPSTAPGESVDDPAALLHGLYWLTANLADRRPLLIVVDDAQWADQPSMRFVEYLRHRVEGLPVCILAAARNEAATGEITPLARLRADRDAVHLPLSSLGPRAVASVVERTLGSDSAPEFAQACLAATGGNPFYLKALLASASSEGLTASAEAASQIADMAPEVVRRSVLHGIARLGSEAVALADAVAVLGATSVRTASRLAGMSIETVESVSDALAGAHLFRSGRPLDFAHPIVRGAVYGALPAGRRSIEHAKAARLMADEGADPPEIAAHLLAVEPAEHPWVVEQLSAAAEAAAAQGAPDTAAAYLTRALAESPQREVQLTILLARTVARLRSGQSPGAIDDAIRALELAETPEMRTTAAIVLREVLTYSAQSERAVDYLEPVVEELEVAHQQLAFRVELSLVGAGIHHIDTGRRVAPRLRKLASAVLGGEVNHPHALAVVSLGLANNAEASAREISQLAERAAHEWHTLPPPDQLRLLNHLLPALIMVDSYDTARELIDVSIERAQRTGSWPQFAGWMAFRSLSHYRQGYLLEAEADARSALGAAPPGSVFVPFALAHLAHALIERGDLDAAEAAVSEAGVSDGPVTSMLPALLAGAVMRLRAARGETDEAAKGLLETGAALVEMCIPSPSFLAWRSDAALCLLARGESDEARELVDEELRLARAFGAQRALGIALRVSGLVEGGGGGLELLRESAQVLDGSGARLEHARSLIEYGAALRRAGQRRAAREALENGLETARERAALPLVELAREELRASGARLRRDALRGRDALTGSELRVARMARDGMTNREIAQALFVTQKTVEAHLRNAYQKLDIPSRAGLTEALD